MITEPDDEMIPVWAEIADLAEGPNGRFSEQDIRPLASAALMHIVAVLTRFEDKIDDEWRHELITAGAGLYRLAGIGKNNDGR